MNIRALSIRAYTHALALLATLGFLPPLVTRLVMGQAFHATGDGKLRNFDNTVSFFAALEIPFPELNAAFVARLEYYGGALLILGLAPRLVAALLSSTMVVAILTADRDTFLGALRGTGEAGLTDVVPFVYLLFLVWIVFQGPGPLALDAWAKRWLLATPPLPPRPVSPAA
jgi:putative oxidoreductase